MKKISYCFLFMLVFLGCGDEKKLIVENVPKKRITWRKDGKEMVLIPSGSFEMGDHHDEMSTSLPIHTVTLDEFYMDVHEVTIDEFRKFSKSSTRDWVSVYKHSYGKSPMSQVRWSEAVAYAKWVGKRLPTEAEWEYAARGGLIGKRYPWGDDAFLSRDYANSKGMGGEWLRDQWDKTTAPVGSFKPNGYGLYDMAGNVSEWCQDQYEVDYYSISPANNPLADNGSTSSYRRVLRGGSWYTPTSYLRVAYRSSNFPSYGGRDTPYGTSDHHYGHGFRCVADVE